MTLPVWTTNPYTPLALTEIEFEFVGNRQDGVEINLSDYYSDSYTGYVTSGRVGYPMGVETPIPTIGNAISISNFYGASAVSYAINTDKASYAEGEVVIFTISAPLADNTTVFWEIVDVTVEIIISPEILPNGSRNINYTPVILSATGGTGPYTWAVNYGALPTGMSLAANGRITGTPTSLGSSLFAVTATDTDDNSSFKVYSLNVDPVPIQIAPTVLTNVIKNIPYTANIVALDGQPPYTYTIYSGFLPVGLTLANTGVISGTANVVGTSNFVIKAQDANTNFATKAYTLQVQDVAITISPVTMPNALINAYYEVNLSSISGYAPYTYTVITGVLPPGLNLDSQTGRLSGRATQIGTFAFTIRTTDFNFNTAQRNYTLLVENVAIVLLPSGLPNGTQNVTYSTTTFAAEGGTAPYSYAVSQGALPAGLTLSSGGVLSGTPTAPGSTTFKIRVTDADGNTKSQDYSINITAVVLLVNPASVVDAYVSVPYAASFTASGGVGPYTWAISTVATPSGMTFSNGALTGTPVAAGQWVFTITATDSNGNRGARQYTLYILPNNITPTSLPTAIQSAQYTLQLAVERPYGNYIFSNITEMPAGLSLTSDGLIQGIPLFTGQYQIIVSAQSDVEGAEPLIKDVPLPVLPSPWTFVESSKGIAPIEVANGEQLIFDIVAPPHISPDGIVKVAALVEGNIVASSMTPLADRAGTGRLSVSKSMLPLDTNSFGVHILNGFDYIVATYGQITLTDE